MSKSNKTEFINPFKVGVNYEQFLASIPKGVSVEEYCKDELTEDQIKWLVEDLTHFHNNKKNK